MPNDTIPEWAALIAQETYAKVCDAEPMTNACKMVIAIALVEAERRGLGRAAKVADRRAAMASQVSHPAAIALLQALPDAIRKLMESSDEA